MVVGPVIGHSSCNGAIVAPRTVRLLGLPVALFLRAREHHDDLLRELTLIRIRHAESNDAPALPSGLAALVAVSGRRYGAGLRPIDREDVAIEGDGTADLTYQVRPEMVDEIEMIDEFLDAADEFCRTEQLLTLPREPDVVELGHWFCREFRRQINGLPPTPWQGPVD